MGILAKVAALFKKSSPDEVERLAWQRGIAFGESPLFGGKFGDYFDNTFADISAMAKAFAKIEPYFIGANRKPKPSPLLNALYAPNQKMSAYQFRKTLAISLLTNDKFYILLHDKNDDFSRPVTNMASVTGYDIILPSQVSTVGQETTILIAGRSVAVSEQRLLEMSDTLDPRDLSKGYSLYRSVKDWAQLDDSIREAQLRHFKVVGALPPGIFQITSLLDDYTAAKESIKQSMREGHGNSEPLFGHVPFDKDGKPLTPTLDWKKIDAKTEDVTNDTMNKNIEQKISGAAGVPDEIKGKISNSNYASVIMAEWIMADFVTEPLAMAIYSKLTAELSRVFGNIGGEFAFDIAKPMFADEQQKIASTDSVNLANIATLQDRGYTVEGAVEILGLPARFLGLANDKYRLSGAGAETDDDVSVQDGQDTPESATAAKKTAKTDEGYVPRAYSTTKFQEIAKKSALAALVSQIDAAIAGIKAKSPQTAAEGDPEGPDYIIPDESSYHDDKSDAKLAEQLAVVVIAVMFAATTARQKGAVSWLNKIGFDTSDIRRFTAGDQALARKAQNFATSGSQADAAALIRQFNISKAPVIAELRNHLANVAKTYNAETAAGIRKMLDSGLSKGLSRSQLVKNLKTLVSQGRAERLAVTELHRIDGMSQIEAMKYYARQTGANIYKSPYSKSGSPCEFCQSYIGSLIPLDNAIVPLGATMVSVTGEERVNDYEAIHSANFHPHCECGQRFVIIAS